MSDSEQRAYSTRSLHTLRDDLEVHDNRDLMFKVYDQTCSSWRQLVDVRFKLLALVPVTSVGSLVTAFFSSARDPKVPAAFIVSFATIGLMVTTGLWIYDRRNFELHKELISSVQTLEKELGLQKGVFLGRPTPNGGFITHGTGTTLVYLASFLAWVCVAIFAFAR